MTVREMAIEKLRHRLELWEAELEKKSQFSKDAPKTIELLKAEIAELERK